MQHLLAHGGGLERALPGFREREPQQRMAAAVAETLAEGGALVCEAATGTGKSLAYLLPAATSGRRVVVSTATKALQAQLLEHDLPLVAAALGRPVRAEVVKGRSNYVCRLLAAQLEARLFDAEHAAAFARLRPWLATTQTGDRAELDHVPPAEAWAELAVGPDRCRGRRCPLLASCFSERVRQRAARADVVLVNHALLFADLGLRLASDGQVGVLPEYDCLVLDEAHALEDAAASWLGVRLGAVDLQRLARDVDRACELDGAARPHRALVDVERHGQALLAALPRGPGRVRLRESDLRALPTAPLRGLGDALAGVAATLEGAGEECDLVARAAERLRTALHACVEADVDETVVFSEAAPGGPRLCTAPIDVAPTLRRGLWDELHAAVLCSATLAVDGELGFVRRRLGLGRARELVLASPFDHARQALLYVPRDAPDPRRPGWERQVAEHLVAVVRASRGRALCLFTSHRALEAVHAAAAPRLRPYTVLRQGGLPRERLLQRFRDDVESVLFATTGFWQGVDVRGEACSCVVIDRLPFVVPSDPLHEARAERIAHDGGSPFEEYALPAAALLLKQGFGRLLRADDDRGVVAVLDGRLRTARYGPTLLAGLPPARRVQTMAEVEGFFARSGYPEGR